MQGWRDGPGSTLQSPSELAHRAGRRGPAARLAARSRLGTTATGLAAVGHLWANPRAFAWSFAVAGGFYLLILIVALIGTGGNLNPETAGYVLFPFLMAGLLTGLIARSRPVRWGIWLYPLVVFGIALAFSVVSNLGRVSGG